MSRLNAAMTLSQMEEALAMEGRKPHIGSRKALHKISGALLPLKKNRKYSEVAMWAADRLELYGRNVYRLYAACGGNAIKAATVLMAYDFAVISNEQVKGLLKGEYVPDLDALYAAIENHIPGYSWLITKKPRRQDRPKGSRPGGAQPG